MRQFYVNTMQVIGLVMILVYGHLYFAPWQRFRRAADSSDWPTAGANLNQIRHIVFFNLVLGLIVVVVGATGRYWG